KVSVGNPAVYNDPALSKRLLETFQRVFGPAKATEIRPVMVSEDFSEYGRAGVPSVQFWVGAANPQKLEQSKSSGTPLPSLHSSEWAPEREAAIKTAVTAEVSAALELLAKP